ncbi:MAG: helix-turn-helix domain-containing protein [Butyrivibrio sp.]|nr:helix-turn-helix domain-containing protein [Acetatifactor muris]MCM1561593.1 helix-turn-helix domain-containing protein [Butyrivibrio sp.]
MDILGNRIKALRKAEGLTQKDFSKRLLISQSYLSGLENGNEVPANKFIKLICLEFGVREDWLVNGNGEMYDDVYENSKETLAEVSNYALLKILTLLTTHSNVEYGFCAYSLNSIASMLFQARSYDENSRLIYLELIQNLFMNLDRALSVAKDNKQANMENHKNLLLDNLNKLLEYVFNCL